MRHYVALSKEHGTTVREISRGMRLHHGAASGALSALHAKGEIVCLQEKRDRCHVYVLPEHAGDRPIRPQGRVQGTPDVGHVFDQARAVGFQEGLAEGRADAADAAWQAGYDEGVVAGRNERGAWTDYDLREAEARGREQAKQKAIVVADEMFRLAAVGKPVMTHSTQCWRYHVPCAILAVRKAVETS